MQGARRTHNSATMAKDKRLKRMRKLGVDYGPMAGAEQLRWRFAARRVLKKSHRADYSPSEAEQKVRESAATMTARTGDAI